MHPSLSFSRAAAVCTAALLSASAAFAAAPPEAASCAACHGANGMGNAAAGYPRLAGLSKTYIADQLRLFASGQRNNAIMSGMAKPLSAAQMKQLAAYYADLPTKGYAPAAAPAAAEATLGQRLAERGDWEKGIPACIRCHGPGLEGVGQNFPPLAGQSATYIADQIKAWQSGSRAGDPLGLMHTVAVRMTAADTQAVAAWIAAQPLPAVAAK